MAIKSSQFAHFQNVYGDVKARYNALQNFDTLDVTVSSIEVELWDDHSEPNYVFAAALALKAIELTKHRLPEFDSADQVKDGREVHEMDIAPLQRLQDLRSSMASWADMVKDLVGIEGLEWFLSDYTLTIAQEAEFFVVEAIQAQMEQELAQYGQLQCRVEN